MKLLDRAISMIFGRQELSAADLPPPETPKTGKGASSLPSFLRNPTPQQILPQLDRSLATTDITGLRSGTTPDTIRTMVAASPDLSAAVFAYLRSSITGYVAVAKNRDGTFNIDATKTLQQILARIDVLPDYKLGFNGVNSIRSLSESLGKELLMYGACAIELVLDKARLPSELRPISVTTIKFGTDGQRRIPAQRLGSVIVDLDIPTFFYVSLDQDLLEPYTSSPMEAALQPVIFAQEFQNDLRRIVKKAIHPRVTAKIDVEKFLKIIPPDAQLDDVKRNDWMTQFIGELEQKLNQLKPEDAVVYFDALEIGYLTAGNTNHDAEVKVLSDVIDAKVATGAKAMPSTLGHGSGSQNIASVETMLFMKSASGAVQEKLNELYSRALTLAVRLFGLDVVVTFEFDSIDLRPEAELEAFKTMRQSRVLELLSLGFLADEEASLQLTGALPSPNFQPLSGTGFFTPQTGAADAANTNGHTNQSSGGPSGGALNKGLKPKTPQKPKGPVKAEQVVNGDLIEEEPTNVTHIHLPAAPKKVTKRTITGSNGTTYTISEE